jgi:hypothetical protein
MDMYSLVNAKEDRGPMGSSIPQTALSSLVDPFCSWPIGAASIFWRTPKGPPIILLTTTMTPCHGNGQHAPNRPPKPLASTHMVQSSTLLQPRGTVADSRNEAATCHLPPSAPNVLVSSPHGTIGFYQTDTMVITGTAIEGIKGPTDHTVRAS